jgi:hypothetical protein
MADVVSHIPGRVTARSIEELHELLQAESLDAGCTGGPQVAEDGSASIEVIGERAHLAAIGRRTGISVRLPPKTFDPRAALREVGKTHRFEATGGVPRGRGVKVIEGKE